MRIRTTYIFLPLLCRNVYCLRRWKSEVKDYPALDSQLEFGPSYEYEYNTRETYGGSIGGWGPQDPLNATWWHLVTEGNMLNTIIAIADTHVRKSDGDEPFSCHGMFSAEAHA
jgi:hypothetical protein